MTEPTNREIMIKVTNLCKKFDDFRDSNSKEHEAIIKHLEVTNGRVNGLEKNWEFSQGVTRVVVLIFVPIFLAVIYSIIRLYIK